MKKKIYLLIFLSVAGLNSFAQLSAVDYKSDEYASFKASKTYFVKTGNDRFDTEVENALKDLWKVTSFEVINDNEFKTKIKDKATSYILPVIISTGKPNQDYHYLALVNGGVKSVSHYNYNDMLAYCPINHFQNEMKNTDCAYRVRNMIESMVSTMEIVQKNDIRGNSKKIVDRLMEVYNLKAPQIKDRTLLFCNETLGRKITQADIAGIYPYKFELCDRNKIEQVIKDKSKEYYYFQPTITLNKSMFVFDPSNGDVLYGAYQMMGLNINKGNLEDLAKAVKGKK
jgi:hypothetical protein